MRSTTDGVGTPLCDLLPEYRNQRIHLIGIGGAGMSGAAAMLTALGARVSGSDLNPFPGMGELVRCGVRVNVGHSAALLDSDVQRVVISAAIPNDNPEWQTARQRGLPVMRYAEWLGTISGALDTTAIAGTHGKSTTTALTTFLMDRAGLDPSFVIGARSAQLGGSSRAGCGGQFVVEACEFGRSFLQLRPKRAAILNVEADHLDCFRQFDAVVDAFGSFAALVPSDGTLVTSAGDEWAARAAQQSTAEVETFGFGADADWRADELQADRGRFAFRVSFRGTALFTTRLAIPGRHNVLNALAAIALAHHAGAPVDVLSRAVPDFSGIERRLSWRGEGRGVTIVDDYAHHPTEVRAALQAARDRYTPKRLWVVFQPHQYARTCDFMDAFADSFGNADEVIVNDIYGAREADPTACQRGAQELTDRLRGNGRRASYLPTFDVITEHLLERFDAGDVVVTMGAGDVWKVADELVARICTADHARRAVGA